MKEVGPPKDANIDVPELGGQLNLVARDDGPQAGAPFVVGALAIARIDGIAIAVGQVYAEGFRPLLRKARAIRTTVG